MTLYLFGICAVLTLSALVVAVLCLSAVGHLHQRLGSIEAGLWNLAGLAVDQHAESLDEIRFQSRASRKAANNSFAKLLETLGIAPPDRDWAQVQFDAVVSSDEFKNATSGCIGQG
jgi:hypothetical protein